MTRIAIVTGASRGIGAAVAERLAQGGFSVVVNYAGSKEEASELAKKIEAAGGRAVTAQADVSKPAEVARMFDATEREFGGVDVLVNTPASSAPSWRHMASTPRPSLPSKY